MAEKNHHYFDRQKLLDYLAGKLTNEEAHLLEKLILEDPQYAEALEGLESISSKDVKEDLAELDARVSEKISNKPNLWYRVAAAIAILAVASSILYITLNQFQPVSKEETLTLREEQAAEKAETETTELADPGFDEAEESRENISGADTFQEEPEQRPSPAAKPESGEGLANQKPAETEEELLDAEPISEPVIESITETETVADPKVFDTSQEYDVSEPLTAPVTEKAVRLKRNERMKDQPAMPAAADFALADEPDNLPRPVIGLDAFHQYLDNSLVYPAYARQHNIQGTVELIFMVGADSIPREIEVARSVGGGCDEEAIRILREGPKWIPLIENGRIAKEPVNLEILFRLK